MENNNKEVEQFNITSLWHKSIYEALIRTEDDEKICTIGGVEVAEALQQDITNLSYIKFQYLNIFATELRLLLSNARAKIDKIFFLKSTLQLTKIQDQINKSPDDFVWIQHNDVTHEETAYLTNEYFNCLNSLSKIRAECVWQLKDTLFGEIKDKAIGMDKQKGGDELIR